MRIALLNPRGTLLKSTGALGKFWQSCRFTVAYRRYWSGLGTALPLLAALTPAEHETVLVDENCEEIDFNESFDLVAITAMTQQANRAYQIAERFRENGTTVVLGGIHATVLPEEALQHCHAVVVGEGETIWPTLLDDFKNGRLKRAYRSQKKANLALSPCPRYDLMASKNYRIVWVQTTRGCPHDCEYCCASKAFGAAYRFKPASLLTQELDMIARHLGRVRLAFSDDNFFSNPGHARSMIHALAPFQFKWTATTDISIARRPDILDEARDSGCEALFIGLESVRAGNLDGLDRHNWKFRQRKKYSESIRTIQSRGIGVIGFFIVGLDDDDSSIFTETANFIVENHLWDATVSVLTPLPGTRLRKRLATEGRLLQGESWDSHTGYEVNLIHPRLSRAEMELGVVRIYKKVNDPSVFLDRMEHFKRIRKSLFTERNSERED